MDTQTQPQLKSREEFAQFLIKQNPAWSNIDHDTLVDNVLASKTAQQRGWNKMVEPKQPQQEPMSVGGWFQNAGQDIKDLPQNAANAGMMFIPGTQQNQAVSQALVNPQTYKNLLGKAKKVLTQNPMTTAEQIGQVAYQHPVNTLLTAGGALSGAGSVGEAMGLGGEAALGETASMADNLTNTLVKMGGLPNKPIDWVGRKVSDALLSPYSKTYQPAVARALSEIGVSEDITPANVVSGSKKVRTIANETPAMKETYDRFLQTVKPALEDARTAAGDVMEQYRNLPEKVSFKLSKGSLVRCRNSLKN